MIPLQRMRDDPESIREGARLKGEEAPVDEILELDAAARRLRTEVESAARRAEARLGRHPRRADRRPARRARRR